MSRLEISSINPIGREQRIDTNFVELYTTTDAHTTSIDVASAAAAALQSAWASATATVTAATGAYTTAIAISHHKVLGKTVHCQIQATVTTVGTGTGDLKIQLPATANSTLGQTLAVYVTGGVGATDAALCSIAAGAVQAVVTPRGNLLSTDVAKDGTVVVIGGTYESQ